jgi:LysM repeat protein
MKKIKKANNKSGRNLIKGILLMFSILAVFGMLTSSTMGKKENITTNHVIQENETIWNIAKTICNKSSDNNLNIQNVIIEIKSINHLSSSNIYAGQVIQVPVY